MKKIFRIVIGIIIAVTLSSCVSTEQPNEIIVTSLEFNLNGDLVVNLKKGDEYIEPGFEALFGLENLNSTVVVNGIVDTTTIGVYYIEYGIAHSGKETTLLRAIVVSDDLVLSDVLEFKLVGSTIININLDDTYVEQGFIATFGNNDLSSTVLVDGVIINSVSGVYFLEYSLTHQGLDYSILRAIVVSDDTIVVPELSFKLIGDIVIEMDLGDDYIENGFEVFAGDIDLSSNVEVTGSIDNMKSGTYFIEYTINYQSEDLVLLRAVVIVDNTFIAPNLEFRLLGTNIIDITTGETYLEAGFEAVAGEIDLSGSVSISGEIDNTKAGVYFLEYSISYEEENYNLLRAVVVTETTIVVDPEIVLAPGECTNVEIHYMDLGSMGAATIIDCGSFEVVIDAGLKSAGSNVLVPYLNTLVDDSTIELVIATHPDADHIGGYVGLASVDGIFDTFIIERVLDYGYTKSTTTHEQYVELRGLSGALICSGDDALNSKNLCQPYYMITENMKLSIIDTGHYDGEDTTNDNENSIVVLLEHGDNSFLFTGDAEHNAEALMQVNLNHVDVFQAGHHGSHTANSDILLNKITPTDIILIVDFPDDDDGENGYGIPQQESLDRMFAQTDNIYATGVSGTIIVSSNGTTYTITGEINTILLKDSTWFSTRRIYTGD